MPDMKLPFWLTSLKFRLVAVVVAAGRLTAVGMSSLVMRTTGAELRVQLLVADGRCAWLRITPPTSTSTTP